MSAVVLEIALVMLSIAVKHLAVDEFALLESSYASGAVGEG